MAKATVDLFLKNAEVLRNRGNFRIYVNELEAEIELEYLDRATYLDLILGDAVDRDAETVYYCCKDLRDDGLIEKLGCKANPVEVVGKVLSGNTIYLLAQAIIRKSGFHWENPDKIIKEVEVDTKNS